MRRDADGEWYSIHSDVFSIPATEDCVTSTLPVYSKQSDSADDGTEMMSTPKFDSSISLGNILTLAAMIVGSIIFVTDLRGDIAVLGERQRTHQMLIDANARDINNAERLVYTELKEIRESLSKLERKLSK